MPETTETTKDLPALPEKSRTLRDHLSYCSTIIEKEVDAYALAAIASDRASCDLASCAGTAEAAPESPAELAAEAKWLVGDVIDEFYQGTLREHQLLAAIDRLAALATIQASASAGQLAKDFPPMGGMTECDMGDSYE